jgi:hypothetical protein
MAHQHVVVSGVIWRQCDADAAGDMLVGAIEIEGLPTATSAGARQSARCSRLRDQA